MAFFPYIDEKNVLYLNITTTKVKKKQQQKTQKKPRRFPLL